MFAPFFKKIIILLILITSAFAGLSYAEEAATTSEAVVNPEIENLKAKIADKNSEIKALEDQINKYKAEIEKTGAQGKTLKSAITALEITRKKLLTEITLTQKKIDTARLSIQSLGKEINDKEHSIDIQQSGLSAAIIQTRETDDFSVVESLFKFGRLSEFWSRQAEVVQVQKDMRDRIQALLSTKAELTNAKTVTEKKQKELTGLKSQLTDQQIIVVTNKKQTDQILKETQNKEAEYKKTLAETEARRKAVEQEISDYESQLKLVIDPNSYPVPKLKTLFPPLDGKLVVTQEFGDSEFARQNAGVYSGKGHNGVDLKASVGTPIKAAYAGIILGTGNTDIVCPRSSYGQWILVKHANGLSTIYAHLSLIKVNEGDQVESGDLIGYSGNTGYTTGPHLHFGLFISQGIQITNLKSKVCSGTYRVPVADLKAYLNPMLYL